MLVSCLNSTYLKEFYALSFNVQNLFDGVNNDQEYEEYKPPKWTKDEYEKRLVAVGKALQSIKPQPTIIALQEVENAKVVEELQKYYLPSLQYVVISNNPHSATENALLSKFRILEVRVHNLGSKWTRGQRDILDVFLEIPKSAKTSNGTNVSVLQVIVVHLKSKRNSDSDKKQAKKSDSIRTMQYTLISEIIDTSVPTVILGDFNDGEPLQSLEAHDLIAFELASEHEDIDGTYYFRNQWEQIDHIIIDNLADEFFSNEVLQVWDRTPFINKKKLPNSFVPRYKNFYAVSDHLPLMFNAQY